MVQREAISVFDIFKIGIGPSSSHTLGPWQAAGFFLQRLAQRAQLSDVKSLFIQLYGSLAKTGKGHGTDIAVQLGLSGFDPVEIDTSIINQLITGIRDAGEIHLDGKYAIPFNPDQDIYFDFQHTLPYHPNGLTFIASLADGSQFTDTWYSIGGGFVKQETEAKENKISTALPFPIENAGDLLLHCESNAKKISEIVFGNELTWNDAASIIKKLRGIADVMQSCIYKGCHTSGVLPGGLNVKRRAFDINQQLLRGKIFPDARQWFDALKNYEPGFGLVLDWVSCFALAVNEENACFGRVVTAPTNGSAGVIPAVLQYYMSFVKGAHQDHIIPFLLTAAEIGSIFKKGSTLSAAMGGCQAEIGVSSSMAAAGLTEIMGGSQRQCLMAAEIAMEHHLGLTCDPVAGLVQIPCIERNAMGAVKAITASNLALRSNPTEAKVSLDHVIKTMWETAQDMNSKYKETSEGGLAINIPVSLSEC